MLKLARVLVILLSVLLISAAAGAAVVGQNDQEVRTIAEPILDTVLNGLNSGNYGLYSKYFDDTLKDAISEKKFRQVRNEIQKKMGKYQSRTYLGFQNKDNFTVALWKGRFSANDEDIMIKLVLSKRDDKVQVSGLWFQ